MNTFIIVLGNHDKDVMYKRVSSAVAYYKLNTNEFTFFIMSGAGKLNIDNNSVFEADIMKCQAMSLGIPEDKILVERKSRNTIENLQFSLEIIQKISPLNEAMAIVCSSRFHMKRTYMLAMQIFQKINVGFISTDEIVTQEQEIKETKLITYYLNNILNKFILPY